MGYMLVVASIKLLPSGTTEAETEPLLTAVDEEKYVSFDKNGSDNGV